MVSFVLKCQGMALSSKANKTRSAARPGSADKKMTANKEEKKSTFVLGRHIRADFVAVIIFEYPSFQFQSSKCPRPAGEAVGLDPETLEHADIERGQRMVVA